MCWPIRALGTNMENDQRSSGLRGAMRRENPHESIASKKGSVPTCAFAIEPSELSRHGFFDHSQC